jgi:multimeric flavodoxin WrbA
MPSTSTPASLTAVALVCTLKPSPAPSSSELLASQLLEQLKVHGVAGESLRVVDHGVMPGVETDMGDGDGWPAIRAKILAADILVITTPTWMGHTASVAAGVLERLDAELSETDDDGKLTMYDKVAIVGVVGNEDGAHHVTAELYQALNDVGFTIPAQGGTYWNGEAMHSTDYNDLTAPREKVIAATKAAAANAAHLAASLRASGYPTE